MTPGLAALAGVFMSRFVPFAYGFRPFFLLAGIYAGVAIAIWMALYSGGWSGGQLMPHLWHGHEMLFGFVTAAVAGFMLTAVPSWTGSRGFGGPPLIALVVLWIAGRGPIVSLIARCRTAAGSFDARLHRHRDRPGESGHRRRRVYDRRCPARTLRLERRRAANVPVAACLCI